MYNLDVSDKPAKPFRSPARSSHDYVFGMSLTFFSLLGGSLKLLVPQGTTSTFCPMPSRSISERVNCKALIPFGRFFTRTRWAKANIEQATWTGLANLSVAPL